MNGYLTRQILHLDSWKDEDAVEETDNMLQGCLVHQINLQHQVNLHSYHLLYLYHLSTHNVFTGKEELLLHEIQL